MPIINLPLHKLCASSVTAFIETSSPTLSRHFPGRTSRNAALAYLCEKIISFLNMKIPQALLLQTATLCIVVHICIHQSMLYISPGILK